MVASPRVVLPSVALVAKRLVLEAVLVKKLVEVLLVVVEVSPVKFWSVLEPFERSVAAVTAPSVALPALRMVAKRLVELAVVAKKFVEVALVPVAFMKVKF